MKTKMFKKSLMSDTFSRNMAQRKVSYTYYSNGVPLTTSEARKLKNKGYVGIPIDMTKGMVELVKEEDAYGGN